MSTSGTKRRKVLRRLTVYLAVSAACVVITNVYALFGHGIRSVAMDFMFVYPLAGGLIVTGFGLRRQDVSRAGLNLTGSGVATLTAGALLRGIMVIANTSSPYVLWFYVAGALLAAIGVALMLRLPLNKP
ncbi:MAG: hypothetical protein LBR14_03540 [Clostridiales Family XIII bacterium]|nr:hypothetical protein [Clostridiales Family XIII bacterium]